MVCKWTCIFPWFLLSIKAALGNETIVYERCDRGMHLLFIPPSNERRVRLQLNATSERDSSPLSHRSPPSANPLTRVFQISGNQNSIGSSLDYFPTRQKAVWAQDYWVPNQDILSADVPVETLNISWNVRISQKVFQAHYLQYQTYCILVEHNLYIDHYHTRLHTYQLYGNLASWERGYANCKSTYLNCGSKLYTLNTAISKFASGLNSTHSRTYKICFSFPAIFELAGARVENRRFSFG